MTTPKRGGARRGAGRPRGDSRHVAVRLTDAERKALRAIDRSPAAAIHALIARLAPVAT